MVDEFRVGMLIRAIRGVTGVPRNFDATFSITEWTSTNIKKGTIALVLETSDRTPRSLTLTLLVNEEVLIAAAEAFEIIEK